MGIKDTDPSNPTFNRAASETSTKSTALSAIREAEERHRRQQEERFKKDPVGMLREAADEITGRRPQRQSQRETNVPGFDLTPPGQSKKRTSPSNQQSTDSHGQMSKDEALKKIRASTLSYNDLDKDQGRDGRSRDDDDGQSY